MTKKTFIDKLRFRGFEIGSGEKPQGATLTLPAKRGLPGALRLLVIWSTDTKTRFVRVEVYAGPKGREKETWAIQMENFPPLEKVLNIIHQLMP